MLRKTLAHFVLWLLFQLLVEMNCQMLPFKSKERHSPTATLIDDKLYNLGVLDDPKNNIISMFLAHLILMNYRGKIYRILMLLKVVQTMS